MARWINHLAQLLEAETADLRALAIQADSDPDTFYIGTDISGADLRGQDLRGMSFGVFDPQTVLFDQNTLADDDLLERLRARVNVVEAPSVAELPTSNTARKPGSILDVLASSDIAMDLDGGMVRIYRKGRGVVLEEPPVYLARKEKLTQGKAVGSAAVAQFEALSPVQDTWHLITPFSAGELSDEAQGGALFRLLFKQAIGRTSLRGAAILSISSDATPVQRRAVHRAMKRAGASKVALIDRGLVAGLGAGLPVHENRGSMIVDVGAASTEVALVALSGVVYAQTILAGTAPMSAAIAEHVRRIYSVLLSPGQAEQLRLLHGYVGRDSNPTSISVAGRSMSDGELAEVDVSARFVCDAMSEPVYQIIHAIKLALERTPPELANEVAEDGIMLTGPGAVIPGLAQEIRDHTGLPVRIAADPQLCAVLGCGKVLEHPIWMRGIIRFESY
jgi:rod shape-determining protein MreB